MNERKTRHSPPVAMTIAGSDNSAGAGIQADLKTFGNLGTYGISCVTCVVAEVPGRVTSIAPVPPAMVADQIRVSFGTFPVRAAKTGMLLSRPIIEAVCDELAKQPDCRVVVDPVMVATSGDPLLEPDAVELYRTRLLPMAAVITPNLDEAAVLLGEPVQSVAAMHEGGRILAERFGTAVLMKGGHLGLDDAIDVLVIDDTAHEFRAPFLHTVSTHGTGCTYSAAITAGLALGLPLTEAVRRAKTFVTHAIRNHLAWVHEGVEVHALHHFARTD